MKTKFLFCLFFSSVALSSLDVVHADANLLGGAKEQQIIVNNRILAKSNGKAISVVDLMKKMDLLFYREFPQYSSSAAARYQFYLANWKHVLSEMIDKELIVADAEESKLVVSAGDVRQEMETLFGPNIIENLDKVGLTFEEAYQMVLADITLKRMMYFRVQSKAITQATPQKIRDYYNQISANLVRDNEWIFRVITVRHRDPSKAADAANTIQALLKEDHISFADLADKWKEKAPNITRPPTVSVSEEFHTKEKELSDSFKETLLTMTPDTYSLPLSQKSRADNSTVVRIFYLKNMVPGGVVPFSELEVKIKEKLIDEAMNKESEAYLKKLRQHFDMQEGVVEALTNSDFQPFELK